MHSICYLRRSYRPTSTDQNQSLAICGFLVDPNWTASWATNTNTDTKYKCRNRYQTPFVIRSIVQRPFKNQSLTICGFLVGPQLPVGRPRYKLIQSVKKDMYINHLWMDAATGYYKCMGWVGYGGWVCYSDSTDHLIVLWAPRGATKNWGTLRYCSNGHHERLIHLKWSTPLVCHSTSPTVRLNLSCARIYGFKTSLS